MKKTDVYVVVDTPKKAKKLKRLLDMFGEKHLSGVFGKYHYDGVSFCSNTWYAIEIEIEADNKTEVSIKELRNILAKEYLKEGDTEEKALLEPKSELEVGKWYKSVADRLVFRTSDYGNYGFCRDMVWKTDLLCYEPNNWIEATPQEVEQALVEEARSRYKVGDVIKCLDGVESEVKGNSFVFSNNCLFLNGERVNGGDWFNTSEKVFENGQWADIIKQPQRSEDADNFTDSDIAIVERLYDTLLDNHGYSVESKLLTDARMLVSKIKSKIK